MAHPTAHSDLIVKRRQMVGSARLRGFSIREIKTFLGEQGLINPKTRRPFTATAIFSDLEALKKEWRAAAARDIGEHKARILAELLEVKRAAWGKKKFTVVLAAIERECKILGIDAPTIIKILEEHEGFKQIIFEALKLIPDEFQRVAIEYVEKSSGK